VFGTSASTPVVGSILAMVNDARLTTGKKPIGFINPAVSCAYGRMYDKSNFRHRYTLTLSRLHFMTSRLETTKGVTPLALTLFPDGILSQVLVLRPLRSFWKSGLHFLDLQLCGMPLLVYNFGGM
jgi:hypothetical protein